MYRAYDHHLRQWRAIKVLLPEFSRKQKFRKRFEAAAQAVGLLEHPNIVRIYEVGGDAYESYTVMEICEGGSVGDWLLEHGAMPPHMAVEVGRAACQGMHAAHEAGIVHRGFSPGNVLIDRRGTVKIADFGMAGTEVLKVTRTGLAMGTLGYMAPEQSGSAKPLDERTDVYALGATLYTLVTGNSEPKFFTVDQEPGRLKDVPEALRPIIQRAVSYSAADRYPTIQDLFDALSEVLLSFPELHGGSPGLLWRAPRRLEAPPEPLTMHPSHLPEPSSDRQAVADTVLPTIQLDLPDESGLVSFELPQHAPDPWLTMTPGTVAPREKQSPSGGTLTSADTRGPRRRFDDLYVTDEPEKSEMRSGQFVETVGNWKLNAKRRELEEAHAAEAARPESPTVGERFAGLAGAFSRVMGAGGAMVLVPVLIALGGLSVVFVAYTAKTGAERLETHRQAFWLETRAFRVAVDQDPVLPQDLAGAGGDADLLRESMLSYRRASTVDTKREAAESLAASMSAEYAVLNIQDKLSAAQQVDLGARIRSIQQQRRAVDLAADDWSAASQALSGRLADTFGMATLAPE